MHCNLNKEKFHQSAIKSLILVIALSISFTTFGQKVGVNERGDSIVVFNDGSWRYFDKDLDKDLLKKTGVSTTNSVEDQMPKTLPVSQPKPTKSKKSKAKKKKSKTKSKKNKKANKKANKKSKKLKSTKSKKKKSKGNKKSKVKNPYEKGKRPKAKSKKVKEATAKYTDLEEERFRNEAIRNAEKASQESQALLLKYQDLTYDRVLMEDELKDAYTAPNTTDAQIVNIEKKIQIQRTIEDEAGIHYNQVNERFIFLNKLIDVSEGKRRKMLAKWEEEHPVLSDEIITSQADDPVVFTKSTTTNNEVLTSKQALKAEKDLRTMTNVYINPPARTCPNRTVRFNEFTGKKVVMLNQELFFTKTPDQMKILLKDREYFTCTGGLSNTGGLTYLELEIVIASTSAEKAYGIIEKGSKLSLKMIDGYTISLSAAKSTPGEVNVLEKTVTYKPRYFLDKSLLKSLEKSELDQARLVWMTGYEDYEIFDVDFLSHQIGCLKAK